MKKSKNQTRFYFFKKWIFKTGLLSWPKKFSSLSCTTPWCIDGAIFGPTDKAAASL